MFFETRRQRLVRLMRERQRTLTARKLRNAQATAVAALGSKALIPHGNARSAYLYKR